MTEKEWVYDHRRKCHKRVPADQCPHCERYSLFSYKRHAGILKTLFGNSNEVTIQSYCKNCEYRTEPETKVEN